MPPAPDLQDLIRFVQQDAADGGPLQRLASAAEMVGNLNDVGDAVLGYFVDQARRAGHSWSEIGEALGVSKQAAQQRQAARAGLASVVTFERFTERARHTVAASEECARALQHNYVGTEHLLLAQFSQPEGIAAKVLVEAGLTEESVRRAIRDKVAEGDQAPEGHIPFTPRAIDVFTAALGAALELGHNYIGTEHLLIGMVRTDGLAKQILTSAGLDEASISPKIAAKLAGFRPLTTKRTSRARAAKKPARKRKAT